MSSHQLSEAPIIAIVAGEISGDLLGAGLMDALKLLHPKAKFVGIGGPAMIERGFDSWYPMERLAVMGIAEVLGRLRELLAIRRQLLQRLVSESPDVFIGIDAPDFNLGLELKLKQAGIKTVHYVSPSVWAWRQGRVKKIKKAVDRMLTLLPFETEFYRQHQMPVTFVGHQLAQQIPLEQDTQPIRNQLKLAQSELVLGVLPGSRSGEVNYLMPLFIEVMARLKKQLPDLKFVIPAANQQRFEQIQQCLDAGPVISGVTLLLQQAHEVMAVSDVVLLASGTATLEVMLMKRPMVVVYKWHWLTHFIIGSLVKSPFVSLPNLIANKALVPELIQKQATVDNVLQQTQALLTDAPKREALRQQFQQIHQSLACDSAAMAAQAVNEVMQS